MAAQKHTQSSKNEKYTNHRIIIKTIKQEPEDTQNTLRILV